MKALPTKYVTEDGKLVASDDPNRTIWYGQCGFWTDNWNVLKKVGPGIPCCPKCTTPGFICVASDWFSGAKKMDNEEPGYLKCLEDYKEKCYRHYPKGFSTVWDMVKEQQEKKEGE